VSTLKKEELADKIHQASSGSRGQRANNRWVPALSPARLPTPSNAAPFANKPRKQPPHKSSCRDPNAGHTARAARQSRLEVQACGNRHGGDKSPVRRAFRPQIRCHTGNAATAAGLS